MSDRRSLLRALAAVPLIGGGAMSAAALPTGTPDPFPGYFREVSRVLRILDGGGLTEEAADALMGRWREIDDLAVAGKPTTFAGAVACVEYARREHVQFKILERDDPCPGDVLILALLDGALGVLRRSDPLAGGSVDV